MAAISWDTSFVTSGSSASFGDDAIRNILTNVALGLGESLYWPGSAASQGASISSSGELKLGSLRFARSGLVQGGFLDGNLSLNTKYVSVVHIGSTWTGMVGHSATLYAQSDATNLNFPNRSRWLIQEGQALVTPPITSFSVSFASSYLTTPNVYVMGHDQRQQPSGGTHSYAIIGLSSISTGGFTSTVSEINQGSTSSLSLYGWRAEGIALI